jgi:cell division protein FtsQ
MTSGGSRRGALPSEDTPSAEVLDELLQAFSIDVSDRARFDEIDLSSPEVERLLTPAETPRPAPDVESDAAVAHAEVELEPGGPSGEGSASDESQEAQGEGEQGEGKTSDESHERRGEGEGSEGTPSPQRLVITDDEIPDAVSVKGTLATDSSGERSTIFIDDSQAPGGEMISVEAAAAAGRIEPRLRERRIAVRRALGRKRLKWALIALVVVAVVVGGLAVLGSSLFAVDDVEVEGAVYTDDDALAAVVEALRGTPVLRVDTAAAERDLEAIPWVEDARVTTDFPDGVKIEIRERTPVLAFRADDQRYRVIDRQGRVLDVLDGEPLKYLELTSTEIPPALSAGQFAPQGFGAAASLVEALTPEMAELAESVAVAPDGSDLRLELDGGTEVRFGAAEDLVVKLVRLQTVLDDHADEPISVIDVSTNEVTMQ